MDEDVKPRTDELPDPWEEAAELWRLYDWYKYNLKRAGDKSGDK
jgi:hypothetical protein